MLTIYTDQVFTIGTVNETKQPVVTSPALKNVPDDATFNFDPGGYFGRYLPDTYWFADAGPTQ
jgi:peptide/nickel transport system substrate-binding protein